MKIFIGTLMLLANFLDGKAQIEKHLVDELKFRSGKAMAVTFSPDGKELLVGVENQKIIMYNLKEENTRLEIEQAHYAGVKALLYTSTGDSLFSTGDKQVYLWNTAGKRLLSFGGNATYGWSLSATPNDNYIACGSFERHFRVWEVEEEAEPMEFSQHDKSVLAVAFSPNGKYLTSGSRDQKIHIWDWTKKKILFTLAGHADNIYDIEYSPDGTMLASASKDNSIRLWDVQNKRLVRILSGHDRAVMSIDFSQDGHYLISGSFDHTVRIWETQTGNNVFTYRKHEGPVNEVSFSPNDTIFASASDDETLLLWKLNKEIFVDYYFQEAFFKEMKNSGLIDERRKGESRSEYKERQESADDFRKELYEKYYRQYLKKRDNMELKTTD